CDRATREDGALRRPEASEGENSARRRARVMTERECVDDDARALFGLTRELAAAERGPGVEAAERDEQFPREVFRILGRSGLLSLPYPERLGGGGQPYQTYLQVLEELATAWLTVGLGVSVHTLTCFPLATAGTQEQQQRWLPEM